MTFAHYGAFIGASLITSLTWLLLYLREEAHPEPKKSVLATFLLGATVAPIAAIIAQQLLAQLLILVRPGMDPFSSMTFFLLAAAIEEMVKFIAIKLYILNDPLFDNPVDAMIYMIVAALGFAATENVLALRETFIEHGYTGTVVVWIMRSFGATLIHVLSSAILGYYVAISWFFNHHSKKIFWLGLLVASIVHFTFNWVLLFYSNVPSTSLILSSVLILFLAVVVFTLFSRIKKKHFSTRTYASQLSTE